MRVRCGVFVVSALLACSDDGERPRQDVFQEGAPDGSWLDALPAPDSGQPDQGAAADAPSMPRFVAIDVDTDPDRPAFVHAEDLDGDGTKELIVSVFAGSGPIDSGELAIYRMQGSLTTWSREVVVKKSAGIKFPNAVSVADVDGDGDEDLLLPYGFLACMPLWCGGLAWLENTGTGWQWHDVVKKGSPLFYHHAELADMDGDQVADIVTVGESKGLLGSGTSETQIFVGDPALPDRFKGTPVKVGPGLGSLPTVLDLDGDGDLDIASAQYFGTQTDSVAWYERDGACWTKHVAVQGLGPSIQLSFVPDLLGNGKDIPVLANHTNTADRPTDAESAVFLLQLPADPKAAWIPTKISTGIQSRKSPLLGPQGAPGVFAWGDLDGDGDTDLLVSGDGDPNIYWLQQQPGGSFVTHVLAPNLPQSGVAVADLDGDGKVEAVVSSYEANRLVVFQRQ